MLDQIVFFIKKSSAEDDFVYAQVMSTAGYIKECGCEARVIEIGESSFDKLAEMDKETTLFVTDSKEMAEGLVERGYYCIGLSHERNTGEDFAGLKYVFTDIDQVEFDSFKKAYQRYVGEPWEVIKTDRLLIRETTVEDVDEFYELYKDPEMTRYMEGLFENPEDEKRYQRDYIKKVYGFYGFGVWTIVRQSDNRIIGRAGYSARNGFDEIELGFLIGKQFQHQGYAYEACDAILRYGESVLLLDHVQALVKKDNKVSRHLCEKLGFTESGTVDVEENIYGRGYNSESVVKFSEPKYGEYVRYRLEF